MTKTIEKKIRLKALLIYLTVAIVCTGMILIIYVFGNNITIQKEKIEQYYSELALTDSLVCLVNRAQSEANLYVVTKRITHYNQFKQHLSGVKVCIDSLILTSSDTSHLQQISILLKEKGNIISRLNRQFNNENPLDSISEKLRAYEPIGNKDFMSMTAIVKDTVISIAPKKNFWRRFSEVFSPPKKEDTIVLYKVVDTIKINSPDSIVSEIGGFAEQASLDYIRRMTMIESHVSDLLMADQEISSKITGLLIELYNQTVYSRLEGIRKIEKLIQKNNTYSIMGGIVALILISIFIILIIGDVNKGLAARKALEKANELNRQIMESRHKLLLSVSHDIKTPLNSILGYLKLNQNSRKFSEDDIDSMQNSGKHILALLDNLLEFSSIEQGTLRIYSDEFNLKDLCTEISEMFIPLAKQKNLSFHYNFDFNDQLRVYSDSLKVKQILINILSNSIKYTEKGNVNFEVNYFDDKLSFHISDTGVGIPEKQIESLFKPFARIEKNNPIAEGSGLGLFVVKGLIDLLGGEIDIVSEENEGTKTIISIPVKTSLVEERFSPKNILVIDDDSSFLKVLQNILIELGHHVSVCSTMDCFNEILPKISQYDIVLTDMEMGTFNGNDILKILKSTTSDVSVIIMTARSDFGQNEAIEAGFDSYLRKPVTMSSLKQVFGGRDISFEYDLSEGMFGNDKEAIREVMEIFVSSTIENIDSLQVALSVDDFSKVQAICHKMLPMFMQLGINEAVSFLQKMDTMRSRAPKDYPQWKEDTIDFINKAVSMIKQIHRKFEID